MMNITTVTVKDNFDFEDCNMESENWNVAAKHDCYSSFKTSAYCAAQTKNKETDESLLNIFAQSIEIFGSTMAPWPNSGKSNQDQSNGIFITSESSPKEDTIQATIEANKPQIQSKLKRNNSSNRQNSISRINEESFLDAQQIYNALEPIPIITVPKPSIESVQTPQKAKASPSIDPRERKSSRLQNWLVSLYSRTASSPKNRFIDEEFDVNRSEKPLKSILKKSCGTVHNQKSVSISESEAICITTGNAVNTPKKTIKLRFDNEVSICETFHKDDYSRQSLDYVARQLTPSLALSIKKELNAFKQDMEIHEDARHLTQFYLIK